jgi:hypothetical protein
MAVNYHNETCGSRYQRLEQRRQLEHQSAAREPSSRRLRGKQPPTGPPLASSTAEARAGFNHHDHIVVRPLHHHAGTAEPPSSRPADVTAGSDHSDIAARPHHHHAGTAEPLSSRPADAAAVSHDHCDIAARPPDHHQGHQAGTVEPSPSRAPPAPRPIGRLGTRARCQPAPGDAWTARVLVGRNAIAASCRICRAPTRAACRECEGHICLACARGRRWCPNEAASDAVAVAALPFVRNLPTCSLPAVASAVAADRSADDDRTGTIT